MLTIMVCVFQRKEDSPRERGVIFADSTGLIIDMCGKVVPLPVWDYMVYPSGGCMVVTSGE